MGVGNKNWESVEQFHQAEMKASKYRILFHLLTKQAMNTGAN
jgi:hypothetical protein